MRQARQARQALIRFDNKVRSIIGPEFSLVAKVEVVEETAVYGCWYIDLGVWKDPWVEVLIGLDNTDRWRIQVTWPAGETSGTVADCLEQCRLMALLPPILAEAEKEFGFEAK